MRKAALLVAGVVCGLAVVTAGTAGVKALITGAQIQDGTIKSRDIGNGAIRRVDIAPATVASLRGRRGPAGSRGAQGPPGPAGAQGAQGPAGAQGAAGRAGPQGPAGTTGATGPKGDPGAGVHVTGSVATAADLPPSGNEGDAYIVTSTGDLHVWDGDEWINTGPVVGPAGPQGATGATGPEGPPGPAGPTGPPGADGGLAGYQIVTGSPVAVAGLEVGSATASCPTGKLAIGGGVSVTNPAVAGLMVESQPLALGAGWSVSVYNDSEDPTSITPYAVCANEA